MSSDPTRSGSVGGAADEAGGQYRRGVAALFVAYGLNGIPFPGLPMGEPDAIVEAVALETDFPVDDLSVELQGGRLFVQAKRTLKFDRTMSEVTEQWLRAVRDPRFRPAGDFVAAAAGDWSGPVQDAAEALDRSRRGVTVLSASQSRALNRVRTFLRRQGALADELELICSRAVLLPLQAESLDHEHSERGRLLLDGHVVQKGEGARAWRELLLMVGEAARSRSGDPVAGWLESLRRRDVPLTADAEASRAAHLEARHEAVARYRRRLQDRGGYVDLTSVGLHVPRIALSEMDAGIQVRDPQADERDCHDLFWSSRLCGRVVLTGLPGSGKSMAVAKVVSEWARRDHWALPVPASLRRVAEKERFRRKPLRDEILGMAAELVEPADRPLVREALDDALSAGQAALFLDGLDEAADRSLELASDICSLLGEIHADTDVLLTTRDVAYADAQILGFRDLRLCQPKDADRSVRAVLRAISSHNRIADANQWVEERVQWVKQLMTADSQLGETPLIPVLLASLAANYRADELPRSRSRILEQVVRSVVAKREVKREMRISGVPEGHEEDVALGVFPIISTALEEAGGSAPRSDLLEPVGQYLCHEWDLAHAVAKATASQLLVFWDESGIFVTSGPRKIVSPRLRLFVEIGAALNAASKCTEESVSWVEDTAARNDRGEILILATGLSPAIADALIARACRGAGAHEDSLALEAARGLAEGGRASDTRVRELVERLVPIMQRGDAEAWQATEIVTQILVPEELQTSILDAVHISLPQEYVVVANAQASLQWGWTAERQEEVLELVLRTKPPRGLSSPSIFVDPTFTRVLVDAAAILLPRRHDLAPIVGKAIKYASIGAAMKLRRILLDNGHREIAIESIGSTWRIEYSGELAERNTQMDREYDGVVGTLVELAPHAELGLSQERRLSELGSFLETLNFNYDTAWLSGEDWRPLRREWLNLIATLGGFDRGVIAKQAAIVKREEEIEPEEKYKPFGDLFTFARRADLTGWGQVSNVKEARLLLLRILRGRRASALVAARALAEHPDRRGTATMIRSMLCELPRECVALAVWAYLRLSDDEAGEVVSLAHSRNESVREALARARSLGEDGRPTSIGLHLAKDSVRQVRLAVMERMEDAGEEVSQDTLRLLEEMAASRDPPFTCYRCGAKCEADQDSCSSCHVVTQRPSVAAGESLERLRRKTAALTR